MARDAARERELPEQLLQSPLVRADRRVDLGVGALEPGVGDRGGAAVARTAQDDRVDVSLADQPVEVGPDEVETGRCPPVAEQSWLDVLALERTLEERVVEQVDLADGEVVGRTEPEVEGVDLVMEERDFVLVVGSTPMGATVWPSVAS